MRIRNNPNVLTVGLLLGILMAAMDSTIVATAMGTIVGDLGGLDKFVWVTSAYLIAEMAAMPIFGKLSDMYGRKKFFVFGLLLFMLGSILCGTANSIVELSVYRVIQGISGGALIPIAFTIMLDAVPLEKRGKVSGLFGAAFGLASLFGPLAGSFIAEQLSWQWIFFINLPIGLIAFVCVAFFYAESHERSKQRIDWPGAVALVGAILCLMFALELGGKELAWHSAGILGLFAAFVVLAAAFVFAERRAAEPILSFPMFANRLFASSIAVAVFGGAAFVTASVYIPIFVQGVLGGTAANSGMVLLPMMLSTVVSSTVGGFLMNKFSYRAIMLPASLLFAAGMFLLSTISPASSPVVVALYLVAAGLGIGFSFSVLGNAVIHSLDANQRGSAQSTLTFLRSFGMTIGIAVFGMIQSTAFMSRLRNADAGTEQPPAALPVGETHDLLDPEKRAQLPDAVLASIAEALSSSIATTFAWTLLPAMLAVVSVWAMSKEKLLSGAAPKAKPSAVSQQ